MPRKNNPQQTVENIIAVSAKLFVEKGYDKTSMQNIVDALGMSKGAIFHHFKSKEDILNAVIDRNSKENYKRIHEWIDEMEGMPAKEKITALFIRTMRDSHINLLAEALSSQVSNPRIVIANMRENINISAPVLAGLFKEGIEDGSITAQSPDECAQVFMLLFNFWCDPVLFECGKDSLQKRFLFLQQMMKQIGADIISDEIITEAIKYTENYYQKGDIINDLCKTNHRS